MLLLDEARLVMLQLQNCDVPEVREVTTLSYMTNGKMVYRYRRKSPRCKNGDLAFHRYHGVVWVFGRCPDGYNNFGRPIYHGSGVYCLTAEGRVQVLVKDALWPLAHDCSWPVVEGMREFLVRERKVPC